MKKEEGKIRLIRKQGRARGDCGKKNNDN